LEKIFFHSFRGGTGKSNISANVSGCLALKGKKIVLIDLDIQSPGIHAVFGFNDNDIKKSLNDFLWGKCEIKDTVYTLSDTLDIGPGEIYFIPSSIRADDIIRILREGYDFTQLNKGFTSLEESFNPDYLICDTHPGLYEETLFSIAVADVLLTIMRPDAQDFQGTAVTLEVSRKLNVPHLFLILNHVLMSENPEKLKKNVEKRYNCTVLSMLPHTEDLLKMGSSHVFYIKYPNHPFSKEIETISNKVISITQEK